MGRLHAHSESHLVDGIGWLRTVLLGANDGSSRRRIVGVAVAFEAGVDADFRAL